MYCFLRRSGLKIIDVPGDGNCLFHSISLQCLNYSDHLALRRDTCNLIANFKETYTHFLDNSDPSFFTNEIEKLREIGHFNSDIGDLVVSALANLLNRRVFVLTPKFPLNHTIFTPISNQVTGPDIVILLNNDHYSAILPISRKESIIPAPDLYSNTISQQYFLHFKSTPFLHRPDTRPPASPFPHTNPEPSFSNSSTNLSIANNPAPSVSSVAVQSLPSTVCSPVAAPNYIPLPIAEADNQPDVYQINESADKNIHFDTNLVNNYDPSSDDASIIFHLNDKISNDDFLNFLPDNFYIPLNFHCKQLFNQFRKLQNNFILSVLHLTTLLIYHQHNFVPRGLLLHCNPQASLSERFDKTLISFWQSTLHNSSIILIEHLINHYQTHLFRITPKLNTILNELVSNLEPLSYRSVLARLKHYALQCWNSNLKEKNRKLFLDLNTQNNIQFSDTFLSALYLNPNHHLQRFSHNKPFVNSFYSFSKYKDQSYTSTSKPRNRRFLKNSL